MEKKERFGDLEIDLIIGVGHKGPLLTINDRATGVLKMGQIENKEAKTIEDTAVRLLQDWLPFIFTVTSDNGKEFADHRAMAEQLNIDFFFEKPYHSRERGGGREPQRTGQAIFPEKK